MEQKGGILHCWLISHYLLDDQSTACGCASVPYSNLCPSRSGIMPVLVVTQPINALAFVADGALFGRLLFSWACLQCSWRRHSGLGVSPFSTRLAHPPIKGSHLWWHSVHFLNVCTYSKHRKSTHTLADISHQPLFFVFAGVGGFKVCVYMCVCDSDWAWIECCSANYVPYQPRIKCDVFSQSSSHSDVFSLSYPCPLYPILSDVFSSSSRHKTFMSLLFAQHVTLFF